MSFERPDTVFYDSNENLKFRNALIDLTRTAYSAALERDAAESAYENKTGDLLVADDEVEIGGQRWEYSFYAEKGDDQVEIQSITFMRFDDMTPEAVRLIHGEMLESDIHSEMKSRLSYDFEEVRNAEVELFTRRSFNVQLGAGDVRVRTDLGYMVDAIEIGRLLLEEAPPQELDTARERIFERDDFQEFVRALYTLGLVNDAQVQQFLKQF